MPEQDYTAPGDAVPEDEGRPVDEDAADEDEDEAEQATEQGNEPAPEGEGQ